MLSIDNGTFLFLFLFLVGMQIVGSLTLSITTISGDT